MQDDEETKLLNGSDRKQDDEECGWFWLRSPCLRSWRTGRCALLVLCCASALQGLVVNGLVDVNLTTIERRFGLRSSHTGLIAGAYDIAALLCLLPITYLGSRVRVSRPRWLGVGIVIMGIGSFVFIAPHFISDVYRGNTDRASICFPRSSDAFPAIYIRPDFDIEAVGDLLPAFPVLHASVNESSADNERLTGMRWYFYLGQFLHGVGTVPLYTFGVTYLDDNVTNKMSALYLGIFYSQTIFGTALGYLLGGQTNGVFTNIGSVSASELGLKKSSQGWVGAWWLGFLVAGFLCLALAACVAALPQKLPGAPRVAHSTEASSDGGQHRLARSVIRLMSNPTFCFLCLAGAAEGFTAAGFCAFLPKYLESQFSVGCTKASLIMGLIAVPAGAGGTCLGGFLVQKWELRCAGMLKFCLVCTFIGTLFTTAFLLACPDPLFCGVTAPYVASAEPAVRRMTMSPDFYTGDYMLPTAAGDLYTGDFRPPSSNAAPPTAARDLYTGDFQPLSSTTGDLYTGDFQLPSDDLACPTPPTASSTRHRVRRSNATMNNVCNYGCSCSMEMYDPVCGSDQRQYYSPCYAGCTISAEVEEGKTYSNCSCIAASPSTAKSEKCASTCNFLALFIFLIFGLMFFTFICAMPALSASLRCVRREQRSLAVGVQWLVVRLLGTIPAPVLFGALIDHACLLWHGGGSCLVFDNLRLSKYLLVLALGGKLLGLAWFYLAWHFYVPTGEDDDEEGMPMEGGAIEDTT